MTVPARIGILAWAEQSAPGTPATSAQFAVPYNAGGMRPVRDKADLPITGSTAAQKGRYVQRWRGEGNPTILAHPDALAHLLYHLMGSQASSGTPAKLHKLTMADALPVNPLTFWAKQGTQWWRFADSRLTLGVLRGAADTGLVTFQFNSISGQARSIGTPPLYPAKYIDDMDPDRFKYEGGITQLSPNDGTPDVMDNIDIFQLTLDRQPDVRYGTSPTPKRIHVDRLVTLMAHLTEDFTNAGGIVNHGNDFIIAAAMGALTQDVDPTQAILPGSFFLQSGVHPDSLVASLKIYSGAPTTGDVAPFASTWNYEANDPDPNPAGGPREYDVDGKVAGDVAGASEATVSIANGVTGNYSDTNPIPAV